MKAFVISAALAVLAAPAMAVDYLVHDQDGHGATNCEFTQAVQVAIPGFDYSTGDRTFMCLAPIPTTGHSLRGMNSGGGSGPVLPAPAPVAPETPPASIPATPLVPATPTTPPSVPATPLFPATPTTPPSVPATPLFPATPVTPPSVPATPLFPATPTTPPSVPATPLFPATPTNPDPGSGDCGNNGRPCNPNNPGNGNGNPPCPPKNKHCN